MVVVWHFLHLFIATSYDRVYLEMFNYETCVMNESNVLNV